MEEIQALDKELTQSDMTGKYKAMLKFTISPPVSLSDGSSITARTLNVQLVICLIHATLKVTVPLSNNSLVVTEQHITLWTSKDEFQVYL